MIRPNQIFSSPKYTQIGNAVPVKLATEIGTHLKKLISK